MAPGGRLVVSTVTNEHYLPYYDQILVIRSVRQVVEAVRDPDSWATPAATPSS